MSKSIITKVLVAAVAVAMLVPTAAVAQSSNEGYGGPNNVVSGVGDSGGSGPTDSSPTDSGTAAVTPVDTSDAAALPFTGADLGVLLAAGAILLALGLGLRRLTHRPSGV
jgi:hypothetical protein